ncbi:MAG: hypothetical protein QOF48_1524 [Verrucomicrobiota bacterium]
MKQKARSPRRAPARTDDLVVRGYVRLGKRLVRFLSHDNYERCLYRAGGPRTFFRRIANNDPRPLGVNWWGMTHCLDWLESLPLDQWCEPLYAGEPDPDRPVALP